MLLQYTYNMYYAYHCHIRSRFFFCSEKNVRRASRARVPRARRRENDDPSPQRRIVVDVVAEVIQIQRFAGRRAAFVDGAASARRAVHIDAGSGRSRRGLVRVVHGDAPAHVGDV